MNFLLSYIITGIIILIVDVLSFTSIIYILNDYMVAQGFSWIISCLLGVILFRKFVYKKFFFFSISMQVIQSIFLLILVFSLGMYGMYTLVEIYKFDIYITKLIIIVSTILINFVIRTAVIFK